MSNKQRPLLLLQPAAAAASVLHCCCRASYDVLVGSAVHGRTTAWSSCLKYLCDYAVWWKVKKVKKEEEQPRNTARNYAYLLYPACLYFLHNM
jgi:hypothetical protein